MRYDTPQEIYVTFMDCWERNLFIDIKWQAKEPEVKAYTFLLDKDKLLLLYLFSSYVFYMSVENKK